MSKPKFSFADIFRQLVQSGRVEAEKRISKHRGGRQRLIKGTPRHKMLRRQAARRRKALAKLRRQGKARRPQYRASR